MQSLSVGVLLLERVPDGSLERGTQAGVQEAVVCDAFDLDVAGEMVAGLCLFRLEDVNYRGHAHWLSDREPEANFFFSRPILFESFRASFAFKGQAWSIHCVPDSSAHHAGSAPVVTPSLDSAALPVLCDTSVGMRSVSSKEGYK